MAEEQTFNAVTGSTGKSPALFILSVVALLIVAGLTFYLWTQKNSIVEQNKQLDSEIVSVKAEITELENLKLSASLQAQLWLKEIESQEIKWSNVITRLNSTVPYDGKTSSEKAEFTSYSGSADGTITLTTLTKPVNHNPFLDVAELIEVFNESTVFKDAYVPAISKTENEEGDELASFVINMKYIKPDFTADEVDTIGENTADGATTAGVDSEEVKVTR